MVPPVRSWLLLLLASACVGERDSLDALSYEKVAATQSQPPRFVPDPHVADEVVEAVGDQQPEPHDWAAIGRRPLDVSTAVAWRRAAANDTALAQPVSLALDSTQLYVSDPAAVRISALDRSTGITNWHYGRRGGGPGELVGLAILNRADSGTWVLDNSARRAFRLSPSGEAVQFLGMRTAGNIRRFCQVDARTFAVVIMTGAALFELVIVNDSGTVLSKHRSAFTDLASGPYLAAQGRLMNLRAVGCLLGHSYADRVALIRSSGFADTFRFVERFENAVAILEGPDGARQQRLASGATIGVVGIAEYGDMILFAFGGKSEHKERLIDAYNSRTYEYRGSLLWHERIVDLAGDSNGLFILSGDADGLPAITALKLTPKLR